MEALLQYGSSDEDASVIGHQAPPCKRPKTSAAGDLPAPAREAAPDQSDPPVAADAAAGGAAQPLPSAAEALDAGPGALGRLNAGEGPAPNSHQGRIRSFPHVDGNYPTHVFINVEVPEKARQPLQDFLQQVKAQLPSLEPVQDTGPKPSNWGASVATGPGRPGAGTVSRALVQTHYHISLSRTVAIRFYQIELLVAGLKQQLRRLDRFSVSIGGPEVLVNDERTRTFLALSAAAGPATSGTQRLAARSTPSRSSSGDSNGSSSLLLRSINATSRAFQLHGLPRFYEQPRPHISVAWLLGDCEQQLAAALSSQAPVQQAAQHLAECRWQFQVEKIYCKAGQRPFVVWEAK